MMYVNVQNLKCHDFPLTIVYITGLSYALSLLRDCLTDLVYRRHHSNPILSTTGPPKKEAPIRSANRGHSANEGGGAAPTPPGVQSNLANLADACPGFDESKQCRDVPR
jgi:hypothetical protein